MENTPINDVIFGKRIFVAVSIGYRSISSPKSAKFVIFKVKANNELHLFHRQTIDSLFQSSSKIVFVHIYYRYMTIIVHNSRLASQSHLRYNH